MPMSSADLPGAEKPKTKPVEKSGLAEAAKSSDPLVMKLLWDRGHTESGGDTDFANLASDHNVRRIAAIDAELTKLGFDI